MAYFLMMKLTKFPHIPVHLGNSEKEKHPQTKPFIGIQYCFQFNKRFEV